MQRLLLLSLSLLALSACGSNGSEACKDVCKREAECAEKRVAAGDESAKYDQNECTAACVDLERDSQGKELVENHIRCAKQAKTCAELLECR